MPNQLVFDRELEYLKLSGAASTQVLKTCSFKDLEWFYKEPPASLTDLKAKTLRILNEAISGEMMSNLCAALGSPFVTPKHLLVVNDRLDPIGVLSQKIDFSPLGDRPTDKTGLLGALSKQGLAEITSLRFCFKDPDGYTNVGYGHEFLSSIDYGLCNFPFLSDAKALAPVECERLPRDSSTSVFDLTPEKIIAFVLQPIEDDAEYLTHHLYPGFVKNMKEFCESRKDIAEGFFEKVYRTLNTVASILTTSDFSHQLFEALALYHLREEDIALCHEILQAHIQNAVKLKETLLSLSYYSPDRFKDLVDRSTGDERLSPIVLNGASPILRRPSIADLPPTGGGGGGAEGYDGVLFPRDRASPRIMRRSPLGETIEERPSKTLS